MHGDERSPSDMDCDVTLPRGTQTEMLPTWGLAVCLHTRNGSQQHGAGATGGRSVPCKHCGLHAVGVRLGSDSVIWRCRLRCPVCPKADMAERFMSTRPRQRA